MLHQKTRCAVIACGVAAALLATPAESRACCGWLSGGWGARTTYMAPYYAPAYAPVYSAPACTSCGPQTYAPMYSAPACGSCAPQTVRYVPQTCYRTVYRQVPVTTCSACACSDPCTGCPVTYYRPVTSWTLQATLVPYTTYRIVYDPCSPCVSYDSCWSCGPSVGTTLGAGGACCAPGTGVPAGSVPYSGSPSPTNGQVPSTSPAPETFKKGSEPPSETLKPTPDPSTSSNPGPNLTDPSSRTTFRPMRQAVGYRLIASPPKPALDHAAQIDDGGWRAAKD
jgi:hypothetical protein